MYKRRVRRSRQFVRIGGVLCILVAVFLGVRSIVTRPKTVSLADSYRALSDNELPSEERPSMDRPTTLASETALPLRLKIGKLQVDARIVHLSTDKKSRIQSPANIHDVGWLKKSARPSSPEGFMVVDGHVQGPKKDGVFKNLAMLNRGDDIIVEQADGRVVHFTVQDTVKVPYTEAAETTLLAPARTGVFELRLITCTGTYLRDKKEYSQRLIVTAIRQD